MKIGGPAERLLLLRDVSSLNERLPEPVRILGNGSNVLIDDQGLKGTVIVVRDFPPSEPEVVSTSIEEAHVRVSAGMFLPSLARWTERQGLTGCEFMIGVPGTVGGAIAQNAGANDQEVADSLESAEIFDIKSQKCFVLSTEELKLAYRESILKLHPNWIVVSATFKLRRERSEIISAFVERNLAYRKQKTPYARPSLGSMFTRLPDGKGGWLFPGKLIEDVGLKGLREGGAQISPVHANYITNEGGATFDNVMALIHRIESEVKKKFSVSMRREILIWSDRSIPSL